MAIVGIVRNVLTVIGGVTVVLVVYVALAVLLHPGSPYTDPLRALTTFWCGPQ
jgi:hypothetical protein